MKQKYRKYILIGILVITFIIIFDILQALIYQKSPFIKIKEKFNVETHYYKDKGIITDTYNCIDGKRKTVFKWKKYFCSVNENTFEIIDESKHIKNFTCPEVLEEIYRDNEYVYYLSCMKSKYIKVNYKQNNIQENIILALNNNRINITDLDIFKIDYIKEEINKQEKTNEEKDKKQDKKTSNVKTSKNKEYNSQKKTTTKQKTEKKVSTSKKEITKSTVVTTQTTEKTQDKKNDEYRKKLENKYSVKILYKDENSNYLIGGTIKTEKLHDDNEINKYLKETESTLKKYPNGFFKEMKSNKTALKIYIVNKIDGNYSGMTDGKNKDNITITIGTNGTKLFEWTLHHEIMHYIDIYITKKDQSLNLTNVMKSYNPEGFKYGSNDNKYDYNFSNPNEAYFLSAYGRQNYLEDRAVLFSDMMTRTTKRAYYNDGTPLNKKANLINDQLHKYYSSVRKSSKNHWERFI